jgi:hypothetical protein
VRYNDGVDERLAAQLEYLRSDERLRERARAAQELTPAERLRKAYELSAWAMQLLARQPPELRERFEASREEPGLDAADCLRRLGRGGW